MTEHEFDLQVAEQVALIKKEEDLSKYAFELEGKLVKLNEELAGHRLLEFQMLKFFRYITGNPTDPFEIMAASADVRDATYLSQVLPIAERLMRKGADFEEILYAVESHETLKAQWDQLLMTMKMIGEVEIGEANHTGS